MVPVRRAEKQGGGVDRAAGDRHDPGAVLLERAVAADDHFCDLVACRARLQALDEGVGEQRDVRVLERGLDGEHLRVGLGAHEAREAVATVATDAAARLRILLVEQDPERRMERPEALAREVLAELLQARLMAHGWMRKGSARGRLGWVFSALSVDVVHALGARVVRLELVVRDGPRG